MAIKRVIRRLPWTTLVAIFSAGSCLILGLEVLLGWYTEKATLFHMLPAFGLMQANTAFGFLLCGSGMLFLTFGWRRASMVCGAIVTLLGVLTLFEYASGIDLRIDQLLFEHHITFKTSHPGRMGSNTALSFVLCGIALLVTGSALLSRGYPLIPNLLGSLIVALAAVALFGYLSDVESAYGWDRFEPMAIHTAAGFLLFGLGIFVSAWRERPAYQWDVPQWLVVPAGIGALTVSVVLWQALVAQEHALLQHTIETEAINLGVEIEGRINPQILALVRMARRWEARGRTPKQDWEADAALYVLHQPGYRAIAWMDSTFHLRWIVPREGREAAIGVDVRTETKPSESLESTLFRREMTVVRSTDLVPGGEYLVYVPLFVEQTFDGAILGVFRIDELLHSILSEMSVLGYSIALFDGEEEILRHDITRLPIDEQRARRIEIKFANLNWHAWIWPQPALLAKAHSRVPEITLMVGVLMALLMTFTIYLAQTARFRAREIEWANEELEREIIERKRVEEALRQHLAKTDAILETAVDGIITIDQFGNIESINPAALAAFGYTIDETIGQNVKMLMAPAYATQHDTYLSNYFQTGDRKIIGIGREVVGKRKDGTEFPLDLSVSEVNLGSRLIFTGIVRDITERRQAEEALRESEERYRSLTNDVLDVSQVGITILDSRFTVVWVNQALERYFDIPRDELIGKDNRDLIRARIKRIFEDPERFANKLLSSYEESIFLERFECHVLASENREERWLEYWSQPIRTGLYAGGRIGQYYDVTERRRVEDALLQSQKMEAVGQLTGGVAHDFNNLLTVLSGNLQLLEEQVRGDPFALKLIRSASRSASRGAELIGKLLAFSRRQKLQPKVIDLNQLISGMADILHRTLGENVEIEVVRYEDLWRARADPAQVETALLNLAVNARDAMPSGGKLTIETANVYLDEGYTKHNSELVPGDYVMLAVSDTGTGMSPEVVEQAFDPFFTTKEVSRGSGLGLSMIYGFAKQSGGHVKIYSEQGHGTAVKLYLPRSVDIAQSHAQADSGIAPESASGETILVVEDEQEVRELAVMFLTDLGYRVLDAANGRAALAILEQRQGVDLVFLDLVMPGGMDGPEVAREVMRRHPGIKVLFTSGYTENALLHGGKLELGLQLLSKPYKKKDLARAVRCALDNCDKWPRKFESDNVGS